MLKQMIRQKLQQTLKQQKGKVFPLPLPITAPSCTGFSNSTPSSWSHPFPRSQLGLESTACVSLAKIRFLRNPLRTHAPKPLSGEGRHVICSRWSWPRDTSSWHGIESWCPPAERALQLSAHPPSTGWTVERCVKKQIPGWIQRGLYEWEMSSCLQ